MGGKSSKTSSTVQVGLFYRLKSILFNSKKREKYRIREKHLRYGLFISKVGILFALFGWFEYRQSNALHTLDSQYVNVKEKLLSLKGRNLYRLRENFEMFSLTLSKRGNTEMVKVSDPSFKMINDLIYYILTSNGLELTNYETRVIRQRVNNSGSFANIMNKEMDHLHYGVSIFGGPSLFLENSILTENFSKFAFILCWNIVLVCKVNMPKEIRDFNLDYTLKLADEANKQYIFLDNLKLLLNEFELESPLIFNALENVLLDEFAFQSISKTIEMDREKLVDQLYTSLIKGSLDLYLKAGFDPKQLLEFNFASMPLITSGNAIFSKSNQREKEYDLAVKMKKILRRYINERSKDRVMSEPTQLQISEFENRYSDLAKRLTKELFL